MTPLCAGCGQPVTADDARYTYHEPRQYWHHRCAETKGAMRDPFNATMKATDDLKRASANLRSSIDALKEKLKKEGML